MENTRGSSGRRRKLAGLCAMSLLLCPLAMGAELPEELDGAYVEAELPVLRLNSFVEDGLIQVEDLLEVAEDYEKVPEEFLEDVAYWDMISVEDFEDYALEYQLPAQYVQRFIDDYFVFKQGDKYQYIPVDEEAARHSYDWDNLEHGRWDKDYVVDGVSRAVKVIDVSVFQGNIDWEAVKADGVDYAFIRLGYRGYTKGNLNLDSNFHKNIQGAQAAGVKVGVYFYSQAVSRSEAVEEAEFCIDELRGYDLDLPVVFDIEGAQNWMYRTSGLSTSTAVRMVKAFCDTVEEAGYDSMYYSYSKFLAEHEGMAAQLEDYDLWMAQYYHVPFFPYNFQIWQYAADGRVDGINHSVDLNLMFLDYQPS